MPVYNRAVNLDNTSYYDGATVDNIPVFPLKKHNLDYIICFYFDETNYQFENTAFDKKIIKITFPPTNRLRQSVIFKKEDINKMMQAGYDRTTQILQSAVDVVSSTVLGPFEQRVFGEMCQAVLIALLVARAGIDYQCTIGHIGAYSTMYSADFVG